MTVKEKQKLVKLLMSTLQANTIICKRLAIIVGIQSNKTPIGLHGEGGKRNLSDRGL